MQPDVILLFGLGREANAAAAYFEHEADLRLLAFDDDAATCADFAQRRANVTFCDSLIAATAYLKEGRQPLILRAPGVPPSNPGLLEMERLAPVTTFTGLWMARHRSQVWASITGTKGKSTTTDLTVRLLNAVGIKTRIGGNIGDVPGRPGPEDHYVLELSSYQCHDLLAPAPIHAVTSIFREHTDWHGGHDAYISAKFRPFQLTPAPLCVIPMALSGYLPKGMKPVTSDAVEAALLDQLGDPVLAHNGALAVTIAGLIAPQFDTETMISVLRDVLANRQTLPSRRFIVPTTDGILWVDDALATIPEATLAALDALPAEGTTHLLMGGKDRGQDFTAFGHDIAKRQGVVVHAYGETLEKLRAALGGALSPHDSFEAMLATVKAAAKPGDLVLFSPAAATQEPRQNYTHRAARFTQIAQG
jgi:UDP-N-acetylmuramoyl-L-alanine---L-glutamate ligase